ncbi:hypothetical protein [Nitrosomonas aestuarii]|uniref:hypothetical protein n=1 Tax=Nitrosomonas aestuarii TaxID=52441 RepID=UPI000D2F60CC|nr:hypothetical protein [Nitrosomonas aestuarii]PTN12712.1 hypothetical protein C8R11_103281 [Nitrosomonas aestuarii]
MTSLVYGKTYRIENGFNDWQGGFLDACGITSCCKENLYDVSTCKSFNCEQVSSNTWEIQSVNGNANGTPVLTSDSVFLINQYGEKSYLDVCGGGIHMKDVSTTAIRKKEETMIWIILAHSSGEIHEGDTVSLLNASFDLKDAYLNIDKYPPVCNENLFNVIAGYNPDYNHGSVQWRFLG